VFNLEFWAFFGKCFWRIKMIFSSEEKKVMELFSSLEILNRMRNKNLKMSIFACDELQKVDI
jgi:hypothetical protein